MPAYHWTYLQKLLFLEVPLHPLLQMSSTNLAQMSYGFEVVMVGSAARLILELLGR